MPDPGDVAREIARLDAEATLAELGEFVSLNRTRIAGWLDERDSLLAELRYAMEVVKLVGGDEDNVGHLYDRVEGVIKQRDEARRALEEISDLADKSPCVCEGCACDLGFVVETANRALGRGEET